MYFSSLLFILFCVCNIQIIASEKLPQFAQDWIKVAKLSKVDMSDLKSIKKVPSINEIYHGVLPDNSVVIASRSTSTNRIQCSRWAIDNSSIFLEDKYFEVLKDLYNLRLMKK